jgi:hypothetical protein
MSTAPITRAQRRIVEATDVDGLAVFESSRTGNDIALTIGPHEVATIRRAPPFGQAAVSLVAYAHARAGTLRAFSSLDEISRRGGADTLAHRGTRSAWWCRSPSMASRGAVSFMQTANAAPWLAETLEPAAI